MKTLDFFKKGVPIVGRPFFLANKDYCGKIIGISDDEIDLVAVKNEDNKIDSFFALPIYYKAFDTTIIDVLKRSSNKSILNKLNRISECIKIEDTNNIGDLCMYDIGKYVMSIGYGNSILIDATDGYSIKLGNKCYDNINRMHLIGDLKYEILWKAIVSYHGYVDSEIKNDYGLHYECLFINATKRDVLYKIIYYIFKNEFYENISTKSRNMV